MKSKVFVRFFFTFIKKVITFKLRMKKKEIQMTVLLALAIKEIENKNNLVNRRSFLVKESELKNV
jgi:hypothetical protein